MKTGRAVLWMIPIIGVLCATIGITGCNGKADEYVVIHNGGEYDNTSKKCVAQTPADEVDFLPKCFRVSMTTGKKVSFKNYSNYDVEVTHQGAFNAADPFTLPPGAEKTVEATGPRIEMLDIKSASAGSHGGPVIIIDP
jgi:hypothetical protein